MTLFAVAAWIVGIACGVIIAAGFYAIAIDRPEHHGEAFGVCAPSRRNTLTGAYLDQKQPVVTQDSEELQQQATEIERLRKVIRQRNRTIKRMRTEQKPATLPATVGKLDRFDMLEIRGKA